MFLNMLNETEGKNFLELAKQAMNVDGVITPGEENIFGTFQMELNLKSYELKNVPLDTLITSFNASTKKVRKAVIVEIAGFLYADSDINKEVQLWIENLGKQWGFRDYEMKKMIRWAQDFNDMVLECYNYITKA